MDSITPYLIGISVLLLLSVVLSKGAGRFGIPGLVIFLLIGMLAGEKGPGGFPFSNYRLAQSLGIVALVFILHSGGLDTRLEDLRRVRGRSLVLSTIGVLIATALVGWFAAQFLHLSLLQGLLLGSTVAATDVAAVFTVLRSRNVSLRGDIKPLLELESALNDPMSVFLSVGLLQLMTRPDHASAIGLIPVFFIQMSVGTVTGIAAGRVTRWAINHAKLEFEGLYPVLSVALALLTYGITQLVGGSGFLAVYVSGIVLGNEKLFRKQSLRVFHDGLAWLMQIVMFLTMGLLVLPDDLSRIALSGIALSAFVVFVARPLSVIICLTPFRFAFRDQLMIAWAGLRGAVPIVLATYPLIAGIDGATRIFHLVFFVVLLSVLLQGAAISTVSRWLGVTAPLARRFEYPIQYNPTTSLTGELAEIPVPDHSPLIGRSLIELALPPGALIVLIHRDDDVLVPRGETHIERGDTLLVLAESDVLRHVRGAIESGALVTRRPLEGRAGSG